MARRARTVQGRSVLAFVAAVLMLALAASAQGAVPRFGHTFVIVGENTSYSQITPGTRRI